MPRLDAFVHGITRLLVALLAVALCACATSVTTEDLPVKLSERPPIDTSGHERIETATFSLG